MKIEQTEEFKDLVKDSLKKGDILMNIKKELLNDGFLDNDILPKYNLAKNNASVAANKVWDYIKANQKDI